MAVFGVLDGAWKVLEGVLLVLEKEWLVSVRGLQGLAGSLWLGSWGLGS